MMSVLLLLTVSRRLLVDKAQATVMMMAGSLELLVSTMPTALLALLLPLLLLVSALAALEVWAMLSILGLSMLSVLLRKSELSGRCVPVVGVVDGECSPFSTLAFP